MKREEEAGGPAPFAPSAPSPPARGGGAAGPSDGPEPGSSPGQAPRPHDFQRPRLLTESDARALETIHRKFARSASDGLSALTRVRVGCHFSAVGQRAYFEFIRSLQSPTHLNLVYCLPDRVPFVLEMSPTVLFPMIERLLGGKGEHAPQPARPLTRIEQGLARSIGERFLAILREAWRVLPDLRFDIAETEHNPLLMQIVGPGEPSIVLSFQVSLGSRVGPFQVCLPCKLFDPLVGRLTRGAMPGLELERNNPQEKERILRRLSGTEIRISAELASVPIALSDLLSLRAGDVIDTQLSQGADVSVLLDGRKLFRGIPTTHQGRRAVKILPGEEAPGEDTGPTSPKSTSRSAR